MRKCPNCYKECQDDNQFCPACGYKLDDEGLLYHYTSIDTLNAILSNIDIKRPSDAKYDSLEYYLFKLRATHWMYFNDPLEYKFLIQKLQQYFDEDSDLKQYSEAMSYAMYAASSFTGQPYIISLSKNRDNLDMWRSYSKNGLGIAIGLKPDIISKSIKAEGFFTNTILYNCRYLDDASMMSELAKMKDYFLKVFREKNVALNEIEPLLRTCALFKHPCYINERETRVVLFDSTPRFAHTKFRVANGRNIPYREVTLPITAIKEIVIGPCADKELNRTSIEMQIQSMTSVLDAKINIEFSDLPYRQV